MTTRRPPPALREGTTHDLAWRLDGRGAADAPLLLALHGQGMLPDFFAGLLQPLFDLPIRCITPRAPFVHPLRGTARSGPSWYVYDGNQERFRAELERTEDLLVGFLADVERELEMQPRARALLGFSQGGYCGAFVALRRPDLFGAMVISGARVKVEFLAEEMRRASRTGFGALLCHGTRDASIDLQRARDSLDVLAKSGVEVEMREFESGHAVGRTQVRAIRDWLASRWGLSQTS